MFVRHFVYDEQTRVGFTVNQAAPMLDHKHLDPLEAVRSPAQVATSLAGRISLTRGIALYPLAFYLVRKGYDLCITLGSNSLGFPKPRGLICKSQFGKIFGLLARPSYRQVRKVGKRRETCSCRAVTAYISAAQRIGWDLTTGHSLPLATTKGGRGIWPFSPARTTAPLQIDLRETGLPNDLTMHSFRVEGSLARSLAATGVDEIVTIDGWKMETIKTHYIGAAFSGLVRGGERNVGQSYTDAVAGFLCRPSSRMIPQNVVEARVNVG